MSMTEGIACSREQKQESREGFQLLYFIAMASQIVCDQNAMLTVELIQVRTFQ